MSEDAALSAVAHFSQFNIIHPDSGLKVDIFIPGRHEIDQGQIERARQVRPREDFEAAFTSPEDMIGKKVAGVHGR